MPTPIIDTDVHLTGPLDLWASRMLSHRWGGHIPHVKHAW